MIINDVDDQAVPAWKRSELPAVGVVGCEEHAQLWHALEGAVIRVEVALRLTPHAKEFEQVQPLKVRVQVHVVDEEQVVLPVAWVQRILRFALVERFYVSTQSC